MIEKYNIFKQNGRHNEERVNIIFKDFITSKPIMEMIYSFYSYDTMLYSSSNNIRSYRIGEEKKHGMIFPILADDGKKISRYRGAVTNSKARLILKYLNKLSAYEKRTKIIGKYYNSILGIIEYELEDGGFVNVEEMAWYLSDDLYVKIKTMLERCIEERFVYDIKTEDNDPLLDEFIKNTEIKILPLFRKARLEEMKL